MKRDNRDLAIIILDKLVENGVIKDCTDTNDNTEFDVQDLIEEVLNENQPDNKTQQADLEAQDWDVFGKRKI